MAEGGNHSAGRANDFCLYTYERDVAERAVATLGSITHSSFYDHSVTLEKMNGTRWDIYARIVEDLGAPVTLFEVSYETKTDADGMKFGVGGYQMLGFHPYGDVSGEAKIDEQTLGRIDVLMNDLKNLIKEWDLTSMLSASWYATIRDERRPDYLSETITEPFSRIPPKQK